jgi:hypothetical protein
MSEALAAQEAAHDAVEAATEIHELQQALEDAENAARELMDEYDSTITETPMLEDQLRGKVDILEQWADALSDVQLEEPDEEDDEETREQQWEGAKQEATDAIDALEY